jgi:hypothetical protein
MSANDLLHAAQRNLSQQVVDSLLAGLFSRKLAKQGLTVPIRKKKAFRKWISDGATGSFVISNERRDLNLRLDITAREARRLIGKARRIIAEVSSQAVSSTSAKFVRPLLKDLRDNWQKHAHSEQRVIEGFERRLARRWRRPLELLELQVVIAKEMGGDLNEELRKRSGKKRRHLVEALTRLHARACQVAAEVLVLLCKGYPDGAMARWRSLHEIAVVALYVWQHGEAMAERYLDHDVVESARAADEYSAKCERLGHEPIPESELTALAEKRAVMLRKHGPLFASQYGWAAAGLKGIKKPTFANIEHAVGLDHFRPYYQLASYNVHANPKGILFRLGLIDDRDLLIVGPSNYGLVDPGQNTGLSLAQITGTVTQLAPTMDRIMLLTAMTELAGQIGDAFVQVQLRIESEEAELKTRVDDCTCITSPTRGA